jgi:WD40 repeat protein
MGCSQWIQRSVTVVRHRGLILSVAFSSDGSRVISGSVDQTLRLWDAVAGVHLKTLVRHDGAVTLNALLPDVTRGSVDKTLGLWDVVGGSTSSRDFQIGRILPRWPVCRPRMSRRSCLTVGCR